MESKSLNGAPASDNSSLDRVADVTLEDIDCPLGCPRKDLSVLTDRDRLHNLPGEYTVVKCCTCGLLRTNPRPTPTSMRFYYPDNYGPYLGTQAPMTTTDSWLKRLLGPLARRILDTKSQALPPLSSGRMLEIGCASGSFLHAMAGKGWEVEGIEFSPSAATEARKLGYTIHTGALENAPDNSARNYDLIVGWMVLEHLHEPVKGLQKLASMSKPGAWMAVSVPDAAAAEFRIFGNCWYDLHLPNHLYHFTPETLAAVLNAGGWTIDSVHHQRTINNFLESSAFHFDDKNLPRVAGAIRKLTHAGLFWKLLMSPIALIASMLGQTGRLTVWARRQA